MARYSVDNYQRNLEAANYRSKTEDQERRSKMSRRTLGNIVVAAIIGGSGLFVSENIWTTAGSSSFVSQAEARFGRVGGFARGHYRRAVVAGAIAGAALSAGYGYGYGYGSGYPYYSYTSSYPYGYGYGYPAYGYQSYGYGYGYPYSNASYGWRPWW
jgi:hypothetical protein